MDTETQRPVQRQTRPMTNDMLQERPVAAPQTSAPARAGKPKKTRKIRKIMMVVGVILFIFGVFFGGWWLLTRSSTASSINGGEYQAVFLTTGEVYFGKLKMMNDDYFKLNDIFYIQKKSSDAVAGTDDLKQTAADSAQIELIKLGTEIHGPSDAMVINREHVLYFENLKADGTVTKSIQQYYQGKK